MPVPRDLSSSCGTCVKYDGLSYTPESDMIDEIEQIVLVCEQGYQSIYQAEHS